MDADYAKKRLEKDLGELKRMIGDHFKQREEDEAELNSLQDRIEKRKTVNLKLIRTLTCSLLYLDARRTNGGAHWKWTRSSWGSRGRQSCQSGRRR